MIYVIVVLIFFVILLFVLAVIFIKRYFKVILGIFIKNKGN